ncbi:MAG TPA: hypothetical protein VD884_17305 [Ohtaekwangia sp.]|nr:hypothetical protein [Ohtaekwangia sp.]
MESKKPPIVNIVNRIYPPTKGITGESAAELAGYLIAQGLTVNVVNVKAQYFGGPEPQKIVGNSYFVKTFYNGKNKILRLISNLYEGFSLIYRSIRLKSDVTICMTDPPLLNFWASLFFGKRHPWILWAMDLYPEAFESGQLISKHNLVYRAINKVLISGKPKHIIALGDMQMQFLKRKYGGQTSFTIIPCGIYNDSDHHVRPQWLRDSSRIYLGYCGNLGEAHSIDFLKAVIDFMDPKKYHLILSVYGSQGQALVDYVAGRENISIVTSVKRHELKYIDVHLASLNSKWVNVCVPSKTVSSVCAGSVFLYCGNANSDNWGLLKDAGWLVSDNELDGVKRILDSVDKDLIAKKKLEAARIAQELNHRKKLAFNELYHQIFNITGRKL